MTCLGVDPDDDGERRLDLIPNVGIEGWLAGRVLGRGPDVDADGQGGRVTLPVGAFKTWMSSWICTVPAQAGAATVSMATSAANGAVSRSQPRTGLDLVMDTT